MVFCYNSPKWKLVLWSLASAEARTFTALAESNNAIFKQYISVPEPNSLTQEDTFPYLTQDNAKYE